MGVSSFFASVLVGVLSALLTFSSFGGAWTQRKVDHNTQNVRPQPRSSTAEIQDHNETADDVRVLPTIYEKQEYGGTLPSILLNAGKKQRASIVLAESASVSTTATTTLTKGGMHDVAVADAIVNIFCTLRMKNLVRATSGSGVFISENGVILTNAHVAQFLLLAEPSRGITTKCTIRTGNPAVAKYYADLLYIPPLWVEENAKQLHTENPTGTGERDYALLYVTQAVSGKLPTSFPALSTTVEPFGKKSKNQVVIAAGFPAEIIKTEGLKALLTATIATTTITELFTYTKDNVDLVGIAPSAVGEQGSSGGPIVSLSNTVIALITTRGNETTDGVKSLRAITLPYIDRTIREETHVGLVDTISGNLRERARIFRDTMTPMLSNIVIDELK